MKKSQSEKEQSGNWVTDALFPLYCICGVCYGMIELVKRVIPRDIVGGNVDKLRQIDSLVHIFYESAGTGAAFFSSYLLLRLGSNYGMIMTPLCYIPASILWYNIGSLGFQRDPELDRISFCGGLKNGRSPSPTTSHKANITSLCRLLPVTHTRCTHRLFDPKVCLASGGLFLSPLRPSIPRERTGPGPGPGIFQQTSIRTDTGWRLQLWRALGCIGSAVDGQHPAHTNAMATSGCNLAMSGMGTTILQTASGGRCTSQLEHRLEVCLHLHSDVDGMGCWRCLFSRLHPVFGARGQSERPDLAFGSRDVL